MDNKPIAARGIGYWALLVALGLPLTIAAAGLAQEAPATSPAPAVEAPAAPAATTQPAGAGETTVTVSSGAPADMTKAPEIGRAHV